MCEFLFNFKSDKTLGCLCPKKFFACKNFFWSEPKPEPLLEPEPEPEPPAAKRSRSCQNRAAPQHCCNYFSYVKFRPNYSVRNVSLQPYCYFLYKTWRTDEYFIWSDMDHPCQLVPDYSTRVIPTVVVHNILLLWYHPICIGLPNSCGLLHSTVWSIPTILVFPTVVVHYIPLFWSIPAVLVFLTVVVHYIPLFWSIPTACVHPFFFWPF